MFPNPPGLLRVEPHSEGLRERIWWGSSSNATAEWAAKLGMNLQSSTLKDDESGEPLHVQQRKQIEAYREAWKEAGHAARAARVGEPQHLRARRRSRPRLLRARRRAIRTRSATSTRTRARSSAARTPPSPTCSSSSSPADEAIAAADTLLLTVPNQLGVDYNAHVIESILKYVAPELGWR